MNRGHWTDECTKKVLLGAVLVLGGFGLVMASALAPPAVAWLVLAAGCVLIGVGAPMPVDYVRGLQEHHE